jgi:hypothetical protein
MRSKKQKNWQQQCLHSEVQGHRVSHGDIPVDARQRRRQQEDDAERKKKKKK